ncbi:helix-turn-helix domain-containing protein [Kribbella sp. NPDC050124]|uniref:helix-turn-helix domain-containing protein n=1 Tax=Kribbella sp. NPDC050124 TaxID=3364114 RepID=UPI0037AA2E40
MYDGETRALALAAVVAGESLNSISKRLGVSRATLRDWRDRPGAANLPTDCPRCSNGHLPHGPYAHLLGLYLGDGCLSNLKKAVYSLRIACDDSYPRLIDEAAEAIAAVHPTRPVHRVQAAGYTSVVSYWKHWPCLFPQHGAGPKHLRRIELADWQVDIVAMCPELFLRGLFNADGCRVANWTTQMVGGVLKRYEYPRYMFSNESADIMGLCQWALDLLAVPWRMPRRNALSVARQAGVARLDEFIGPKS